MTLKKSENKQDKLNIYDIVPLDSDRNIGTFSGRASEMVLINKINLDTISRTPPPEKMKKNEVKYTLKDLEQNIEKRRN